MERPTVGHHRVHTAVKVGGLRIRVRVWGACMVDGLRGVALAAAGSTEEAGWGGGGEPTRALVPGGAGSQVGRVGGGGEAWSG